METTAPNKGGRPRKPIDYETLDKLCAIMCTGEECASVLKIDYDTLNMNLRRDGHGGFSEYFKTASSPGKIALRRAQFKSAVSGNATMLIWLGKQYLGQREPDAVREDDDVADLLRKALRKPDNSKD